jgi:hypothetical protein
MTVTTIQNIPANVSLCAIRYRVQVHEGMVVFSEKDRCGPCYSRLAFQRKCGCWYVTVESSGGSAMVAHIAAAQAFLGQWFGGDHCCERGEHEL